MSKGLLSNFELCCVETKTRCLSNLDVKYTNESGSHKEFNVKNNSFEGKDKLT